MEQKFLEVEKRDGRGKGEMHRLRKDGYIPGVVYSAGEDAKSLKVTNHNLLLTVRGCRPTQIFTLKSEDKGLDGTLAFVKDVQTEPIKDQVLHVDFLSVKEGRAVVIDIPVELEGEPPEIKAGLAVLEQRAYNLTVECEPRHIPAVLTVNVANLGLGDSIFASSIPLPDKVELLSSPETTVASLSATRAATTAKPKEEMEVKEVKEEGK